MRQLDDNGPIRPPARIGTPKINVTKLACITRTALLSARSYLVPDPFGPS